MLREPGGLPLLLDFKNDDEEGFESDDEEFEANDELEAEEELEADDEFEADEEFEDDDEELDVDDSFNSLKLSLRDI